jgi:folylpolyglutamate synthase/dihydropteroate synthase
MPQEELAQVGSNLFPELRISLAPSLDEAFREARAGRDRILVTGSLHFAGEALATLAGDPAALEECAQ